MNQIVSFQLKYSDEINFKKENILFDKKKFIEYMKCFNFTKFETLVKQTCLEENQYPIEWMYDSYYHLIININRNDDNKIMINGEMDYSFREIDISSFKEYKETLSYAMFIVKEFFDSYFFIFHLSEEQWNLYLERCKCLHKNLIKKLAFDTL